MGGVRRMAGSGAFLRMKPEGRGCVAQAEGGAMRMQLFHLPIAAVALFVGLSVSIAPAQRDETRIKSNQGGHIVNARGPAVISPGEPPSG